jgi:threonine dehydratase
MLNPNNITKAYERIKPYIKNTPVLCSEYINQLLGTDIYFKFEGMQITGAFKLRGALNALLTLKEEGNLPEHVVAFSSGNHAQAVAYASRLLNVKATIFIPESSSAFKINATKSYGAEVILTKTRKEAQDSAREMQNNGAYFLHPYDDDNVILGQGSSCYEALSEGLRPDVIFASVGGGGWISGTYLAAQLLSPASKVIGGEPKMGNDAFQSFKTGKIVSLPEAPQTIADGARTLALSERTFEYIKKLQDIIEIEEDEIIYWTQMLSHYLKITAEPTSCVAIAACDKWLKSHPHNNKLSILIMLSGGNIDINTHKQIWKTSLS